MRILMSAYACLPGRGSEHLVGMRTAQIAAEQHEVWLLTRSRNAVAVDKALSNTPVGQRVHTVGIDVSNPPSALKHRLGLFGTHWYYDAWQRHAARVAVSLDAEIDFDIVHHITFAAYWSRVGVAAVDKPLVWGPIGGAVTPPLVLIPTLGFVGSLGDLARTALRPFVARVVGSSSTRDRASVILAQNSEVAELIGNDSLVIPNSLAAACRNTISEPPNVGHLIAASRLVPWKGTSIAIRALSHMPEAYTLDIYGTGPERPRLERLASRLGIHTRVRFHGAVPRQTFLASLRRSHALIHPALHDDAPLVLIEALSNGIPVIALDRGGARSLQSLLPDANLCLLPPLAPKAMARAFARAALDTDPTNRVAVHPTVSFRESILAAYESALEPASSRDPRHAD